MGLNLCCLIFHTHKKSTVFLYFLFSFQTWIYVQRVCAYVGSCVCACGFIHSVCETRVCVCIIKNIIVSVSSKSKHETSWHIVDEIREIAL